MLTPEEEKKLIQLIETLRAASTNLSVTMTSDYVTSQLLWCTEKLKEAHDQNVDDVDKIIELDKTIYNLGELLVGKEYDINQLQLKIDQLKGNCTSDTPPPSWEVFDSCDKCGTGEGEPCYNLRKSTSRKLIPATVPHRGRKRKKHEA